MASLYRWASTAVSPRYSSFLNQRCLKSNRKCYVSDAAHTGCHAARHSPRAHSGCLPCGFVSPPNSVIIWWKHSTASVTRSIVSRHSHTTWYIVTLGSVNYKPTASIPRRVREQKEILTLTAESRTSFHKSRVNFTFTHSLRSGVRLDALRVV